MTLKRKPIDGEEITSLSTLSKIKTVEEMMPLPARNQTTLANPQIGEEQYKIIEECLRMDYTITDACMMAGISLSSYYKHRDMDSDFAIRMDRAREFPKMIARAAVQKRIRQGDARTALEFLKLRDRRYKTEPVMEELEEDKAPVVQFISVASNEGANNTTNPDIQTSTKQSSASDISVSSGESGTQKLTGWENEEDILRKLV